MNKEFKNEYGIAVLDVVPKWSNDGSFKDFSVGIYSIKGENNYVVLTTEVDVNGLIDLLVELRGSHIDKYAVQVYAYYHWNLCLRDNYTMLMDNLDLYEEFDMQYEWG